MKDAGLLKHLSSLANAVVRLGLAGATVAAGQCNNVSVAHLAPLDLPSQCLACSLPPF